jgi:hypothetical protein
MYGCIPSVTLILIHSVEFFLKWHRIAAH